MHRTLTLFAALTAPAALLAQNSVPVPQTVQMAALNPVSALSSSAVALPDAPSALVSSSVSDGVLDEQAGVAPGAGKPNIAIAPKYAGIVLPGQTSVPLTAGNKVVYGFKDAFSPFAFVGSTVSALWSYGLDTAPHYEGNDWHRFGEREGVAALRGTIQTLASDAVFSPIFRDDPRYYQLGRHHKFLNRVVYAGTRVLITRTDSGHNTLNAPLLLGYGVAAGMNNLYYPDRDTGAKATFTNYASSLGGAAIGMEVNEFLDDALRIVHLRK